jgi:carboxypeptidase family protein
MEPNSKQIPAWRESERQRRAAVRRAVKRRAWRVAILVLAPLLVVAMLGVLFWFEPLPDAYFVPLWVTEYESLDVPFIPWTTEDRAAFSRGDYFARTSATAVLSQDADSLRAELQALRGWDRTSTVVVYLSAHAYADETGRVLLLPANANPRDRGDVPLQSVLESMAACPAPRKLLVLDIDWPVVNLAAGEVGIDMAALVAMQLERVNFPVLCAASPGQVALASEDLGRSVFNYYLEAGLQGGAERAAEGSQPNGRVSVYELSTFVSGRVDRWAHGNRRVRQIPRLYGNGNFQLIALDAGQVYRQAPLPPEQEYPAWLHRLWQTRDEFARSPTLKLDPQFFRHLQEIALQAERDWRSGVSGARNQANRSRQADISVRSFEELVRRQQVEPYSLRLAVAQGRQPDQEVVAALAKAMAAQGPEAAKAVAAFAAATQGKSPFDVAWPVFQQALADPAPTAERIAWFDGLLHPTEPEPRFIETLCLRRLAQRARQSASADWPAATVHHLLQAVDGEQDVASRPGAVRRNRPQLDRASQQRHNGEVLFSAAVGGSSRADDLLKGAADAFQQILDEQQTWATTDALVLEAFVFLPAYLPYLDRNPDESESWLAAVDLARQMTKVLSGESGAAGDMPPAQQTAWSQAPAKMSALQSAIGDLRRPFQPDRVKQLLEASRQSTAGPDIYGQLDDLLAVPFLRADDRRAVWQAARALGRRLAEATLREDLEPGEPRPPAIEDSGDRPGTLAGDRGRLLRRARWSIALLDLVGLPAKTLEELRRLEQELVRQPDALSAQAALAQALQRAWRQDVPQQLARAQDPLVRERLSLIAPLSETLPLLDKPADNIATQRRAADARAAQDWQTTHWWYEQRDPVAEGLEVSAASIDALFPDLFGVELPYVEMAVAPWSKPLTRLAPGADGSLEFTLVHPSQQRGDQRVEVVPNDDPWLRVTLDRTALAGTGRVNERGDVTYTVPLHLELPAGADMTREVPPAGFLLRATVAGRDFHHRVPVSIRPEVGSVDLFLSAEAQDPAVPRYDLRLRPGNVDQVFYAYIRNAALQPRNVVVELSVGDEVVGESQLALAPQTTTRLKFAPPKPAAPPAQPSPAPPTAEKKTPWIDAGEGLVLRALDKDHDGELLQTQRVPLAIAEPWSYVKVEQARFDPSNASSSGAPNRLTVALRATQAMPGAPCVVDLVLPADRIPGLLTTGTGLFRGQLPLAAPNSGPLELFAENIQLQPQSDEQGTVFLTVDGRPRAFRLRTTFARQGDPTTPRSDDALALRLVAARYAPTDATFAMATEVDRAPPGARLELSVGRMSGGFFEPELVETYPAARREQIRCNPFGPEGAIVAQADSQDWSIVLDARPLVGAHLLRARLLAGDGGELATTFQEVTFDDSPPGQVQFVGLPRQARHGRPLRLQASGSDPISGIRQADFFVGKPPAGPQPTLPPDAVLAPATALDSAGTFWAGQLPLSEKQTGPTDISVRFVNSAGMSTFATQSVELIDTDPIVPGRIAGAVLEGPRPQAGLDVVLKDAQGVEKGKTKTDDSGRFVFENIPPGEYRVSSLKPATQRQADQSVSVLADQTAQVSLELFL